jgi:hypothetical protein
MPLVELSVPEVGGELPRHIGAFLDEADRRIEHFLLTARAPAFVPGDYAGTYRLLRAIAESSLARGTRFCEWGSGFGVVTGLAAALDYEAYGIEVEGELVDSARQLADDFDLPAEFVHGSFVPRGAEDRVHKAGTYSWFTTEGDYAYEELGLDPDDFDVVYAYSWPDEEAVVADLFDRYAGVGAVLVSYHGGTDYRLRRKTARRKRGRN